MIVHIISSHENVKQNIGNLRAIVEVIESQCHTLAFGWVEPAYARAVGEDYTPVDWDGIYNENMAAITRADVIIAEATRRSFGAGYQIAASVRLRKPTLVLRQDGIQNDVMEVGTDREYIKFAAYQEENGLKNAVTVFLKDNDIPTKDLRFNFSIDRRIYNYLRSESIRTGETKAEVIRHLIEREIGDRDSQQR